MTTMTTTSIATTTTTTTTRALYYYYCDLYFDAYLYIIVTPSYLYITATPSYLYITSVPVLKAPIMLLPHLLLRSTHTPDIDSLVPRICIPSYPGYSYPRTPDIHPLVPRIFTPLYPGYCHTHTPHTTQYRWHSGSTSTFPIALNPARTASRLFATTVDRSSGAF